MKRTGFIAVALLAGALLAQGQFVPPQPGGGAWITSVPASANVQNYTVISLYGASPLCSSAAVTINLATLSGFFSVGVTNLASFSCPSTTSLGSEGISMQDFPLLGLVAMPAMTNTGDLYIVNTAITNLIVQKLKSDTGTFQIEANNSLPSISLPNFVTSAEPVTIFNCSSLTNISLPSYVPSNGTEDDFSGNALTAIAIDSLLVVYVSNSAFVSGSIDVSGGTSATPDATGLAYIATLTLRGVTVNTN